MTSEIYTITDPITDERCNIARLPSGLEVYHIPTKHITAHALLGVDFGSVHTAYLKDGKHIHTPDGTAHFLEHKLFDNENGNADDAFTSLGANCNAFTSSQCTAYTFSCTDNFLSCLKELLYFVTHPYFTVESVSKEQGIIAEEIRMYDDSPSWRCYFDMLKNLYGDSPISRDTAGTVDSILKITPELLYTLCADFYVPKNMRLCLFADEKFENILRLAEGIEPKKSEAKKMSLDIKSGIHRPYSVFNTALDSPPVVFIGIKDENPPKSRFERIKRENMFSALFNMLFGESSDFFASLYDNGLISGRLDSEYISEDGFAYAYFSTESSYPEQIFEKIKAFCLSVIENGIDKEQYDISKRVIYGDFIKGFDSGDELPYTLFLECGDIFSAPQFIARSNAEEAYKAFCELFSPNNFVLSVVADK